MRTQRKAHRSWPPLRLSPLFAMLLGLGISGAEGYLRLSHYKQALQATIPPMDDPLNWDQIGPQLAVDHFSHEVLSLPVMLICVLLYGWGMAMAYLRLRQDRKPPQRALPRASQFFLWLAVPGWNLYRPWRRLAQGLSPTVRRWRIWLFGLCWTLGVILAFIWFGFYPFFFDAGFLHPHRFQIFMESAQTLEWIRLTGLALVAVGTLAFWPQALGHLRPKDAG